MKLGTPVFQPRTATASPGRTADATCSVRCGGTWISVPLVRIRPSISPIGVSVNALIVPVTSTCWSKGADTGGGGAVGGADRGAGGVCANVGAINHAEHKPEMTSVLMFSSSL